jgi:ABC-type sugar transport system ATPase subunit
LLRLIAGLIQPNSGEISYDGVNMKEIPPGERKIGMVFQNYALYPHFTSKKNILSYFLFRKKTPELDQLAQEKYRKTSEPLGVEIEYLLDKSPAHLSGGEQQRVALGRCITRDPALFLLDEPFSNLDQKLREKYRLELKKLLRHFNITTVYVTHDQQEALILGDLLTIMNIGRIEQTGTPEAIYNTPHSLFVAEFLNLDTDTPAINRFEGEVIAPHLQGLLVGVRSEDIELCDKSSSDAFPGKIAEVRHLQLKRATILCVNLGKNELYIRLPLTQNVSRNEDIRMRFKKYHLFDKHSGLRVRSYPEA